jgi:hypothetical protein
VYPAGTTVELSDRQAALVIEASPSDPSRPVVRVLCGEHAGKRIDLKTLDALQDRYSLSIVRAIPPPLVAHEYGATAEERGAASPAAQPAAEPIPQSLPQPISRPVPPSAPHDPVETAIVEATRRSTPTIEERSSAPPASAPMRRLSGMYSSLSIRPADEPSGPPAVVIGAPSRPPPYTSSSGPPPPQRSAPAITARSTPPVELGALDRMPIVLLRPAELATLGLDHRAGFMLTFIDGTSTLDDILDACGLPRADALQILGDLLQRKVIAIR